ncbi:MAG: ATP-dependent DNA helicase RecG [Erysipelotrichaceae bacterium]|nr:ATP-dependent DNA helicase RecG [Erysipelotrichaceae bacterium]
MNLKDVRGIGEKTLEHLKCENINTIDDLLFTFPKSYLVYELNNDFIFSGNYVTINAIVDTSPIFIKYRSRVNAIVFYAKTSEYRIKCVSFASDYLRYKLFKNTSVVLYGRYKEDKYEFFVKSIFFDPFSIKIETDYKLKYIINSQISKAVSNVFKSEYKVSETLPLEIIEKYKLFPMMDYLYASHFPQSKNDYIQILRRRKYEEFFWYSIQLELLKINRKNVLKVKRNINWTLIELFIKSLDYELTTDQNKAIEAIRYDISMDYSMNRLVQGDVGCGKSIVAYISALMLVSAGYQAVIMVPTEILANQQFQNIKKLFAKFNLTIELLTSSVKSKDKADILYRLRNNRVNIIVGTHALIEDNVEFYKLGIVIIDEQHRFGVEQRAKLVSKYVGADCLYLTATPIPRTLGLTSFGDLDITSIHSMPNNRKGVSTHVYHNKDLDKLCDILKVHISKGEQIYIVVPLVLENDELDCMDIEQAYSYFSEMLPDVSIGVIHGKQKSSVKNSTMSYFNNGTYQVLIATTVIEVGVDNKNATAMVIVDADRFGLAQIHQLRGRVGRGDKPSYCYLVSKTYNDRLKILESTSDGFEIAMEDLKLRGPGDYLGNQQSGFNGLNFADFQNDFKIWSCAKEDGELYCHRFLTDMSNDKFNRILSENKNQKDKIN